METIYFKQSAKYANGTEALPSYNKFSSDGTIMVISTARKTISFPKTISIMKGYKIIDKDEFEKVLSETLKGNNVPTNGI